MESDPLLHRDSHTHASAPASKRRRVLALIALTTVAIEFGGALCYPPMIAIFESIICRNFGSVDCKSPEVQGELALLMGIRDTIDQIPGLVFALPYGLAADRIGRRPVLLLCIFGLLVQEVAIRAICWWPGIFPLRTIWATPLGQALGGGQQVGTSILCAMITDIFLPEDRSSIFFLLSAVTLFGEIVAPPTTSALMWKNSPWLASLVGLGIQCLAIITAYALPETQASLKNPSRASTHEHGDLHDSQDLDSQSFSQYLKVSRIKALLSGSLEHWSFSLPVKMALAALLFASIGIQSLQLVIQYAHVQFGWTIAESTLLITIKGVVTVTALLIVLPRLSNFLDTRMSPSRRELEIVQGSAWLLTFGASLMAVASRPALFIIGITVLASGWGFVAALRSLSIGLVEPSQIGTINTAIAMVQSGGTIISGPLLASAFRFGLAHKGTWRGLPYMVAAVCFFTGSCLMHSLPRGMSTPKALRQDTDDSEQRSSN